MAVLTVRNLQDAVRDQLRVQAALHGWSMEQEARQILTSATIGVEPAAKLGTRLSQRFTDLPQIELPARSPVRDAPNFD